MENAKEMVKMLVQLGRPAEEIALLIYETDEFREAAHKLSVELVEKGVFDPNNSDHLKYYQAWTTNVALRMARAMTGEIEPPKGDDDAEGISRLLAIDPLFKSD